MTWIDIAIISFQLKIAMNFSFPESGIFYLINLNDRFSLPDGPALHLHFIQELLFKTWHYFVHLIIFYSAILHSQFHACKKLRNDKNFLFQESVSFLSRIKLNWTFDAWGRKIMWTFSVRIDTVSGRIFDKLHESCGPDENGRPTAVLVAARTVDRDSM